MVVSTKLRHRRFEGQYVDRKYYVAECDRGLVVSESNQDKDDE